MSAELKIAELLCTRLCHDLTGPIGAVNNGAEFLVEEGFDLQGQAVELIVKSAQEAVTRLMFFRAAYGKVNDHGEASLSDKKKITHDFFSNSKVALDWPDSHTDASGISVSLKMARLILNLILMVSASLIKGGTLSIRISQDGSGNKQILIRGEGPSIKIDPEIEAALAEKSNIAAVSPKTVQAYITGCLAAEIGVTLTCNATPEMYEIIARQPQGDAA